jgi:hypothetical protein
MTDLDAYLDKFSESGKRILQGALSETRRRDQNFISPEHILYALIGEEPDLFNETLQNLSIDPQTLQLALDKRIENIRHHTGKGFRISSETTEIFKSSMDRARSENRRVIDAADLCYVLTNNKRSLLDDILQNPESPDQNRTSGRQVFQPSGAGSGAVRTFELSSMRTEDKQLLFGTPLRTKPSEFLTEFSLNELIEANNTSSAFLGAIQSTGGHGSWFSGGGPEQTTHSKHKVLFFKIKPEDSDGFNEEEFIASLGKDLEDSIKQCGLQITGTNSPNSLSLYVEYENEEMKGQIEISGQMKHEYYELHAIAVERSR